MLRVEWNEEKNQQLQSERGVSFEEVEIAITSGLLLDIIIHPNQEKYPEQKMFIVLLQEYVYQVPFVEDDEKIFLKTIIPNRNLIKKYLQ